jgi:hypothetical protein
MRVLTLYSHGEHLHDRIMLIRWVDWTYKTDLTPVTRYWNVHSRSETTCFSFSLCRMIHSRFLVLTHNTLQNDCSSCRHDTLYQMQGSSLYHESYHSFYTTPALQYFQHFDFDFDNLKSLVLLYGWVWTFIRWFNSRSYCLWYSERRI